MNDLVPLAQFAPVRRAAGARATSRAIGAVLTACVYGLLVFLALQPPPVQVMPPPESAAVLLPDSPHRKTEPLPAPYLAPLVKPHAVSVAPPDFTVATAVPPAPAPLAASATPASPLPGGVTAGNGASAGSANGSDGTGDAASGCLDAAWARMVSDHVRPFFYYPSVARMQHVAGIVMVDFVVLRDGRVDKVEIGKSSGDWALDDAAYNIVRKAEPMPAIPQQMHLNRIEVELPIQFGRIDPNLKPSPGSCS